jgi:hypothetical protein
VKIAEGWGGALVQRYRAFADVGHYLGQLVGGKVLEMGFAVIAGIHANELHLSASFCNMAA